MDKNIWTDNAIEAARHAADQHIKEGLRVAYIPVVLLLVVFPLITWTLPSGIRRALANITPRHVNYTLLVSCTTAFVVSGLIPDLMRILMYTGFQFGQRQMLPPVLPSSCELARQIEERNDVWPCAKEELHAAWRTGGLSAEVLWQNMLWWMLLQVVWVIGFGFAAAWMSETMSSKEGKACTLQSCSCHNPEQVERKESTVLGAKSEAQIDFRAQVHSGKSRQTIKRDTISTRPWTQHIPRLSDPSRDIKGCCSLTIQGMLIDGPRP